MLAGKTNKITHAIISWHGAFAMVWQRYRQNSLLKYQIVKHTSNFVYLHHVGETTTRNSSVLKHDTARTWKYTNTVLLNTNIRKHRRYSWTTEVWIQLVMNGGLWTDGRTRHGNITRVMYGGLWTDGRTRHGNIARVSCMVDCEHTGEEGTVT
jgi:hypothetical protein